MRFFPLLTAWFAVLGSAPLAAETALPVEIVTVEAQPVSQEHVLFGTIEATNAYPAAFRTGGRLVEINVEVGDTVAAGDVIARIDPVQAEAAEAAARASLAAAEAALQQAAQARDRAETLLERGVGTRATLDEAEGAYTSARSSRDQAVAQLDRAKQTVEDTVIRAIEDVIVIERLADTGEIATAGQAVVRLASQEGREAVFYAPDIGGLSAFVGHEIRLTPRGSDGSMIVDVSEVSPVLTDTGTVEVRAPIPSDAVAGLVIGATVEGHVKFPSLPFVQVPWTALTATAQGPAVWTVDPETMRVALTGVEIAAYSNDKVLIDDGLTDGDMVVGAGAHSLFSGRLVKAAEVTE